MTDKELALDRVQVLNSNKKAIDPEEVITSIRDSFIGAEMVYTMGSCYQLYNILSTIFECEAYCYKKTSHILTKIDGYFYDIRGEVEVDPQVLFKVVRPGDMDSWMFNIHDVHVECPNCDELFLRQELTNELDVTRKRYSKHK